MPIRTPDGRTLTVEGLPAPFTTRWSSVLWTHSPAGGYRLHTGAAGARELVARHLGEYERFVVREVSWNGARLVSYEDPEIGGTTMVWIGPYHELYSFIPGTAVPFEVFMDELNKFDMQDSPDGLVLKPRPGSQVRLGNVIAVNTLDGVCSVQVKPRGQAESEVPARVGKRVRGGELWKLDEPGADGRLRRTAMLVNESTATSLIAINPDDPRFAAVADSLVCTLS
ncbi:hypothetical protein [Nonomuraea turcica]|uniref:hypothetical protein n=1 Tax=Nonomuraea sp. G32 TaxID=3067274 RepID=UPI00273BCC87|nr:hypothetical protein [Nonomuraea sp. G32]MDP4504813.1 hypothetical protein [Nonomuraea sp. G32]